MIQLVIVRHATAEHGGLELVDHERRLSSRGVREAGDVAARAVRAGVRSEIVLTSTAARATATAAAFAAAFGVEAVENADLYAASGTAILEIARENGASELTVVSHDPGVSALVSELTGDDIGMRTAAVAVLTWNDGDWSDVGVVRPDEFTLLTPRLTRQPRRPRRPRAAGRGGRTPPPRPACKPPPAEAAQNPGRTARRGLISAEIGGWSWILTRGAARADPAGPQRPRRRAT